MAVISIYLFASYISDLFLKKQAIPEMSMSIKKQTNKQKFTFSSKRIRKGVALQEWKLLENNCSAEAKQHRKKKKNRSPHPHRR